MQFLCIDDSSTMRKILSMTLGAAGHNAFTAENGKKALEYLASNRVDCIISDINMPEMGGMEFLGEKAKRKELAEIPVLMLTTELDEALKVKALGLGASAFLAKPFQKDQLLEAIKEVFEG